MCFLTTFSDFFRALAGKSIEMGYLRQDPLPGLSDPFYATSDADPNTPDWLLEDATLAADETSTGGTDWQLKTCCGTYEIVFLCLMAGYLVIIYFTWNTMLMKPMKLLAVFVHGKFMHCNEGDYLFHCSSSWRILKTFDAGLLLHQI